LWSHESAFGGDPPTPFDRPAIILKQWIVDRAATSETYVACTLLRSLDFPFGSAFRYSVSFAEPDRFSATAVTPYWLSIAAIYGNINCDCDADVAAPFGVYNAADVSFVDSHIGCPVGTGDPDCDAADVNCNGTVDAADKTMANCQFVAAWADPACCLVAPSTPWGWVTRPLESNPGAVRVLSPTTITQGATFGAGQQVSDDSASAWDASLVLVTESTEFVVPDAPLADPDGVKRNRYLGFQAPISWSGRDIAVRVTLQSLNQFPAFNGEFRWSGMPQTFIDNVTTGSTFQSAILQCAPSFVPWTQVEPMFLRGIEVVPGSTYSLQAVDSTCPGSLANENCYSAPLIVETGQWGDLVAPFENVSQPDFGDITAAVEKFKDMAGAISKTRAQVQPNLPDPASAITFSDISAVVDAFKGFAYPFAGPTPCP